MGRRPGSEPPPTYEAQEGSSSKAESGSPESGQVGTGTPTSHPVHTGSQLRRALGLGGHGAVLKTVHRPGGVRKGWGLGPGEGGRWGTPGDAQPEGLAAGRVPRRGRAAGGTPELGGSCRWEARKALSWSHSDVWSLGTDSGQGEGEG